MKRNCNSRCVVIGICLLVLANLAAHAVGTIDINTATAEQLDKLPGIGPAIAERIVQYRREHGPFRNVDDIQNVKGVGKSVFDKFRSQVTVGVGSAPMVRTPSPVAQANTPIGVQPPIGAPDVSSTTTVVVLLDTTLDGDELSADAESSDTEDEEPVEKGEDEDQKLADLMSSRIELNTASEKRLQTLPGVGPAKVKLILERRSKSPFTSLFELREILPERNFKEIFEQNLAYVAGAETAALALEPASGWKAGSRWFAAIAILCVMVFLTFRFRNGLAVGLERGLAQVRLLPRFALVSLGMSLLVGVIVWTALERVLFQDVEARFDQRRRETATALIGSTRDFLGTRLLAGDELKWLKTAPFGWLKVNADSSLLSYSNVKIPRPAHLQFSWAASAAGNRGSEIIFLDRRGDSPIWYFSPGIPQEHRTELQDLLARPVDKPERHLRARIRLPDATSLHIVGDPKSDTLALGYYVVSKGKIVAGRGEMAAVVKFSPVLLDHLRHQTGGHHLVLQTKDTMIATSLFQGRPVVDLPHPNVFEATYLARRTEIGARDPQGSLTWRASGQMRRDALLPRLTPINSARRYFLGLFGDATGIYGGDPGNLDAVTPYARVWMPLPRIPERQAADGVDKATLSNMFSRKLPRKNETALLSILGAFSPDVGMRPEMVNSVIWKMPPDSVKILEENLDWRPSSPVDPINLWSAKPEQLDKLLRDLAINNPTTVLAGLQKFLGPQVDGFSSSSLKTIDGLSPEDAEILSGLLYRHDPKEWDEARAALALPLQPNQIVTLNEREFTATLVSDFEERGGGSMYVLLDRSAFHEELKTLRIAAFGTIGITTVSTFAAMMITGLALGRPLRRLAGALRRASGGDLSVTLPAIGRDEFTEIAAGFNGMINGIRERLQLETSFRRYVPEAVVRSAMRGKGEATLGGQIHTCSIMFADIRGFTHASQLLPANDLVRLINLYFAPVVEEVNASGGVVDKFIGDAVLAVWGAPDPVEDYADRAIAAAIKIQKRIYEFNNERAGQGQMQLFFGIGIATGEVLAGHVGTPDRTDWTVIGSDVNLSQRISSQAWPYRIFISEKTLYSLRTPVPVREYESLAVKGFAMPVVIHAVLWYQGHSGPLLSENDPGGWHLWNGTSVEGPFTLEELIRNPGFSVVALIARLGEEWIPFWCAAKGLRIWSIKIPDGIKGPFTLDEAFAQAGSNPDALVRVQGDPEWRALKDFAA